MIQYPLLDQPRSQWHEDREVIFPASNEYGIPDLLISPEPAVEDLQELNERNVLKYGRVRRSKPFRGIFHFYASDHKFANLWHRPYYILETQVNSIVEPNFSTGPDMPFSVGLYQIYMKRWIARYWQKYHMPVWVDLTVNQIFHEIYLLGVPAGYRYYFLRGYNAKISQMESQILDAEEIAGDQSPQIVCYGGGKKVKEFCKSSGIQHILDEMQTIKRKS